MQATEEQQSNIAYIHSQSANGKNGEGSVNPYYPVDFAEPEEGYFAARALSLALHDVNALNRPATFYCDGTIPADYLSHLAGLGLKIPEIIEVADIKGNDNLSQNIQSAIASENPPNIDNLRNGSQTVISTFTPTSHESALVEILQAAGHHVTPEFSGSTLALANKALQHVLLNTHIVIGNEESIPLRHESELLNIYDLVDSFEREMKLDITENNFPILHEEFKNHIRSKECKLLIKHVNGTAGEGIWPYDPEDTENAVIYEQHLDEIFDLLTARHETISDGPIFTGENQFVIEKFFNGDATEHSLHLYVDPITGKTEFIGTYDQLLKPTEQGGTAHAGCQHPMADTDKANFIKIVAGPLGELLAGYGVTGQLNFDILVKTNPDSPLGFDIHVMEVNTRAGANLYARRLAEAVMETKFKSDKEAVFEFHTGMKFKCHTINELFKMYPVIQEYAETGQILFSNAQRFQLDSWDVILLEDPTGTGASLDALFRLVNNQEP